MPIDRSRRGVCSEKNLRKSDERFSRKIDFSLFPLGRHMGRQVEKRTRYDSVIKVLNTRRDQTRGNVVAGERGSRGGKWGP